MTLSPEYPYRDEPEVQARESGCDLTFLDRLDRLDNRRFTLMQIAFKQFIGHGYPMSNERETAEHCVRYVDAALAAMEKKPDAENG